ncbi:hypothetical protein [Sinorhizobium mexicanum]|uniref:Uncharacterized protein n=1 Tax=Sinorhizobium mexicanum TaxID=375549 RepID=A0A859QVU3_9HYPH|nr:hypothetical protein [Sinorhizobium mexicanum]MBP1883728.1 hypothetical protein [Sinorhizobium mexicanum]QLL62901.1 hypothetical protein FKV68_16345 [Sinorhizobium mexicanum]
MRYRVFAALALAVAVTVSGLSAADANAQMRTGKGEYYSGIQRKHWPGYLFFWITGRDRETALGAPERNAAGAKQPPKSGRNYPAQ